MVLQMTQPVVFPHQASHGVHGQASSACCRRRQRMGVDRRPNVCALRPPFFPSAGRHRRRERAYTRGEGGMLIGTTDHRSPPATGRVTATPPERERTKINKKEEKEAEIWTTIGLEGDNGSGRAHAVRVDEWFRRALGAP
ncbi:hypothetical protein MTO96_015558 [Rhipicephalus appendiculatus]